MTGTEPAVELADAGKRYVRYEDVPLLLKRFRFRAGGKRSHLWAVRHVNLEVESGETVGVIGRNGSGKSTMLRMLAGVTAPTEGSVRVRGRVAPLIAVGVGFHPELTGRENVYVNGSILGMSRAQIDRRFSSIVAFAELEQFVDTPVKFYSSGMLVRLGFAAAVSARPEVLLVDEILAVGDLAFQAKCFERMAQIKTEGTSILVVSHNLNAIRRLCTRVLVLHDGEPKFLGETDDAISTYHDLLASAERLERGESPTAPSTVELGPMQLVGPDGRGTNHVRVGDELTFRTEARFNRTLDNPTFVFRLTSEEGQIVYHETTYRSGTPKFEQGERAYFEVRFPANLVTASYTGYAGVRWGDGSSDQALGRPVSFFVSGRPMVKGLVDLSARLEVRALGGPGGSPGPTPGSAVPGGVAPAAEPASDEVTNLGAGPD